MRLNLRRALRNSFDSWTPHSVRLVYTTAAPNIPQIEPLQSRGAATPLFVKICSIIHRCHFINQSCNFGWRIHEWRKVGKDSVCCRKLSGVVSSFMGVGVFIGGALATWPPREFSKAHCHSHSLVLSQPLGSLSYPISLPHPVLSPFPLGLFCFTNVYCSHVLSRETFSYVIHFVV